MTTFAPTEIDLFLAICANARYFHVFATFVKMHKYLGFSQMAQKACANAQMKKVQNVVKRPHVQDQLWAHFQDSHLQD